MKVLTFVLASLMTSALFAGCTNADVESKAITIPVKDAPCEEPFQIEPSEEGAARNLVATQQPEGIIFLDWTAPEGPQPSIYRIFGSEWTGDGSYDFYDRGFVSGNFTSARFHDLTVGHIYAFQVVIGSDEDMRKSNIAVAKSCDTPTDPVSATPA